MSVRIISANPSAPAALRAPDLHLVPQPAPTEQLRLALRWEVGPGVPAVPEVPLGLRVVADCLDENDPALLDLPDPRRWAAQLAQAVSEVSVGERPPGQLTRWLARDQLARLAARAAAMASHPAARAQRGVPRARTVRAVRVCPVAPGVIEASAVLVGGERSHAIAMRLEAVAGRWLATVVDMR